MKAKEVLQNIEILLISGRLEGCFVEDPVDRILNACMMFERFLYKNFGQVTDSYFNQFYRLIYNFTVSVPLDRFSRSTERLDPPQKEVILRNLGKVLEQCSECNLASYVQLLL